MADTLEDKIRELIESANRETLSGKAKQRDSARFIDNLTKQIEAQVAIVKVAALNKQIEAQTGIVEAAGHNYWYWDLVIRKIEQFLALTLLIDQAIVLRTDISDFGRFLMFSTVPTAGADVVYERFILAAKSLSSRATLIRESLQQLGKVPLGTQREETDLFRSRLRTAWDEMRKMPDPRAPTFITLDQVLRWCESWVSLKMIEKAAYAIESHPSSHDFNLAATLAVWIANHTAERASSVIRISQWRSAAIAGAANPTLVVHDYERRFGEMRHFPRF